MVTARGLFCVFWLWAVFYATSLGLKVDAPEECGGSHVTLHTSAYFGPAPNGSGVLGRSIFAPYPASDEDTGIKYQREVKRLGRIHAELSLNDHILLNYLLTRTPWSTKPGLKSLFGTGPQAAQTKRKPEVEALEDGCHRLQRKEDVALMDGRVAVVSRGNCDFVSKVYNMQKDGAVGVILVNYEEDRDLWNMELNHSKANLNVEIPAVMIAYREWRTLAPCRDKNITVSLTGEGEAAFDIDYGKDVLTWAMMRGMALWILLQCGVNAVRYKRRHSDLTARADAIARMPSFTFDAETEGVYAGAADDDEERDRPICAICLEVFVPGDEARRLECTHLYHKACIDPWLVQSSSCPVCKRDISGLPPPPPPHFYGSVSAV